MNETTTMLNDSSEAEVLFCEHEQKWINDLAVQLGFSFLYLIIFCLGFFGNLLVIVAVMRQRQMKTVTNLFILNLAFSDVVMCLFAVPFTPLASFTGRWMFGEVLCILFPFSQGVSVYISTLTLTIIAVDRFVVIIYPYRARMQVKTCLVLIGIIDLLAMVFTAPYAFYVGLMPLEGGGEMCNETWDGIKKTAYGAFTNVMQFVLPFVTIIFCYTAIIKKLEQRSAQRPGAPRSAAREEQERARNARTNRMLISMVLVFGICWLPLNTINFLNDLDLFPVYCWEYYHFMFFICHVMAMSSTCFNPFIYGRYNEAFQKEFINLIPSLAYICGPPLGETQRNQVSLLHLYKTRNNTLGIKRTSLLR